MNMLNRNAAYVVSAVLTSLTFSIAPAHGALAAGDGAEPLMPTRTYYQIDQPMPLTVAAESGKRELVLLKPDNTEIERGAVPEGKTEVDAGEIFKDLYKHTDLIYMQLLVDGKAAGPAMVMDPMVERAKPVVKIGRRGPELVQWNAVPPADLAMAGFHVAIERCPLMHTDMGDIKIELRPDMAPNTCWNFLQLVEGGFYTHIPFHRILGATTMGGEGFVIQAGDPTGTGLGGPGYTIDLEPSTLPHDLGVISMAREGGDLNSASSQFFICLSRERTKVLDKQYASFGQTIGGLDVVQKISEVKTDPSGKAEKMPYIQSVSLVPADPRTPGQVPTWMAPKVEEPAPKTPAAAGNGESTQPSENPKK